MTDQTLQFKQRGIHYFSSGFITLQKIKHIQFYSIHLWIDRGSSKIVLAQEKYNGEDPKELVKKHTQLIDKTRLGCGVRIK